MPAETIIDYRVEVKNAIQSLRELSAGFEGNEKKAAAFNAVANKMENALVSATDKGTKALLKQVDALDKQSQALNKTPLEKLTQRRDRDIASIQKSTLSLQQQEQAIKSVTASYQRMADATGGNKFQAFGDGIKNFMANPMQGAGSAAEGLLGKLGPLGVGVGIGATALISYGVAAFSAAKSLGELGDSIGDTAARLGIGKLETQQLSLAMKMAGGEISSLEGMMKKLSAEIEDNGGENLDKFGIQFRDFSTGAVLPTTKILENVIKHFEGLNSVTKENFQATTLLGKGMAAALPDMKEMFKNLTEAQRHQMFTKGQLDQMDVMQQKVALLTHDWDIMVATLKQKFTVPMMWLLERGEQPRVQVKSKGFSAFGPDWRSLRAEGGSENRGWGEGAVGDVLFPAKLDLETGLRGGSTARSQAGIKTDEARDKAANDAANARVLGATKLEDQLTKAKAELAKIHLSNNVSFKAGDTERTAFQAQQKVVADLEAKVEAFQKSESLRKQLPDLLRQREKEFQLATVGGQNLEDTSPLGNALRELEKIKVENAAIAKADLQYHDTRLAKWDAGIAKAHEQAAIEKVALARKDETDKLAGSQAAASRSVRNAATRNADAIADANRRALGTDFNEGDITANTARQRRDAKSAFDEEMLQVQKLFDEKKNVVEWGNAAAIATANLKIANDRAEAERIVRLTELDAKRREDDRKTAEANRENASRLREAGFDVTDQQARTRVEQEIRTVEARGVNSPTGQRQTAANVEQLRTQAALLEYDQARAKLERERQDAEKRVIKTNDEQIDKDRRLNDLKVEGVKNEGDLRRELDDAHHDRVLKTIEIEKRQLEEIKSTTQGLLHTLFTNPKSFGDQLKNTLRDAVLKPVEEKLADVISKQIYGVFHDDKNIEADPTVALKDEIKGLNKTMGETRSDAGTLSNLRGIGSADDALKVFVVNMGTGGSGSASLGSPSGIAAVAAMLNGSGGDAGRKAIPDAAKTTANDRKAALQRDYEQSLAAGSGSGTTAHRMVTVGDYDSGSGPASTSTATPPFNPSSPSTSIAPPPFIAGVTPPFIGGSGASSSARGIRDVLNQVRGKGGNPLSNLKKMDWGGFTRSPERWIMDEKGGMTRSTTNPGGKVTGVGGAAGMALDMGGMYLAERGLMGKDAGTWGGIGEGALGGAALGLRYGGALGAGIGAAVGASIGIGEKIAGVESKVTQAKRLVKQRFGISIDDALAGQIVSVATSKYGGKVSMAVRDPDVRAMLELYGSGTGQRVPLSLGTPRSGGLEQSGGRLSQATQYLHGASYVHQSSLPVAGGGSYNTFPSSQPMSISVNIAGRGADDFIKGSIVSPEFVTAQYSTAQRSSNNRVNNAALQNVPGLIVS